MKLAHYGRNGETRVGLVNGGLVFDVLDAAKTLGLALHNESITIDRLLSDCGVSNRSSMSKKR